MESFLTLILLILVLILVLGQNLRLSVVLMMNLFFLIFVRQIPKVIQRPMDPPRLPLPQIRSTSKRIFSARAKKNSKSRRKFRVFYEKPPVEAFMDPFEELDHEENLWDFDTRPTYLSRGS